MKLKKGEPVSPEGSVKVRAGSLGLCGQLLLEPGAARMFMCFWDKVTEVGLGFQVVRTRV